MIASVDEIYDITGYSADENDIRRAQAIVEVFAGKTEILIKDANDIAWMKYAVAWQTAYMSQDEAGIYEQANVQSMRQNDTTINFGDRVYAVAPLVVKAVSRLSWNKSKTVNTAGSYGKCRPIPWECD